MPKIDEIKQIIGEGIHTSLRKFCDSDASYLAWWSIGDMCDEEWDGVVELVAEEVLKKMESVDDVD